MLSKIIKTCINKHNNKWARKNKKVNNWILIAYKEIMEIMRKKINLKIIILKIRI